MHRTFRRIMILGISCLAAVGLTGFTRSGHAMSTLAIANRQPMAVSNQRNRFSRMDGRSWTNRVNLAAYQRRSDYCPSLNWNARDLGGYYAGHGYWTRRDRVFRGGDLHWISANGIRTLQRLQIREVIDLRSYHHQGGADPQEGQQNNALGVRYREYPVNTYAQKLALYSAKRAYGGEIYKYGAPFTLYWQARNAYRQVFNDLLANRGGAVYFHCIDGRDRTGIMSALYLAALGVSHYTIFNDFLLTNYYDYKYPYKKQVAELNHFYWTVNHYYGNINNYLRRGLGLTGRQINQLRRMYLVKK